MPQHEKAATAISTSVVIAQIGDQMSDVVSLAGVLNAALEIADKRRETLARLRAALEKGDDAEALKVARALCGVENEEESSN